VRTPAFYVTEQNGLSSGVLSSPSRRVKNSDSSVIATSRSQSRPGKCKGDLDVAAGAIKTPAFFSCQAHVSPGDCEDIADLVKGAMLTIFDKVEAAYLERALHTYKAVVRSTDIARLMEKFPELIDEEMQSINSYFTENGTLEGLAVKFRDT